MPNALDAFVVKNESSFSENCMVCEPSSWVRPPILLLYWLGGQCSQLSHQIFSVAKLEIRNNCMTGTLSHLVTLNPKVILLIKN